MKISTLKSLLVRVGEDIEAEVVYDLRDFFYQAWTSSLKKYGNRKKLKTLSMKNADVCRGSQGRQKKVGLRLRIVTIYIVG